MSVKKFFSEMSILFPLLTIYTIGYFGVMVYDFAAKDAFDMQAGFMIVYITLVGAYAANKEVRRWMGQDQESHKGAFFVYMWMLFLLVAFVISCFKTEYVLPADLVKVSLQVLGVFFGSKVSKGVYNKKSDGDLSAALSKQDTVLEMIKANGRATRKEVQDALKISDSTAGRFLNEMQEKGLIKQVGQFKDTHYVLELVLSE